MQNRDPIGRAIGAVVNALTPSLGAFNRFFPHDPGGERVLAGAAYGQGPHRRLDVYAPRETDRAPVMVFIHGGSWDSGDRREFAFAGAAFSSRGFVTVLPDYRLAPEVRFPDFLDDCAAAVRWTRDNIALYGGDGDRIVLCGHSAGAYNAVMLGLDPHYLADAGVPQSAIRGVIGLSGPYDFLPLDIPTTKNAFGHAEELDHTQPIHFARKDCPPTLLIWGEKDDLVGRRSIANLAAALKEHQAPVETRIYPKATHADTLLALSPVLRWRAPVLEDCIAFARRVTSPADVDNTYV